jgi:hypothetical protein
MKYYFIGGNNYPPHVTEGKRYNITKVIRDQYYFITDRDREEFLNKSSFDTHHHYNWGRLKICHINNNIRIL